MSKVQQTLDQIAEISTHAKNENIEIELRCLIDERLKFPRFIKNTLDSAKTILYFKNLIKTLLPVDNDKKIFASINETINFIESSNQSTSLIKQLTFIDGIQQKKDLKVYSKQNLIEPIFITDADSFSFKLGINKETLLVNPPTVEHDHCRLKLRLSIMLNSPEFDGWRIDITLVKSVDANTSIPMLKRIRDMLFIPKLTPFNFVEMAPWNYADTIELELEHISDKVISEKDIGDVINNLLKLHKEKDTSVSELFEISKIISHKKWNSSKNFSLKNITPQVIELTKLTYFKEVRPKFASFWLTDKADGKRSIIIVEPRLGLLRIVNDQVVKYKIPIQDIGKCMADCEFVTNFKPHDKSGDEKESDEKESDEKESNEKEKLYIFDVIMYDNTTVTKSPFHERKAYFKDFEKLSPMCIAKEFVKLGKKTDSIIIKEFYESAQTRPYEIDGLIFTEENSGYSETLSYKWKPIEKMTIDFLIKKCPKQLRGIAPYNKNQIESEKNTLYLLFSGINQRQFEKLNLTYIEYYKTMFPDTTTEKATYFPIQFSPSDEPFAYLFCEKNPDLDDQIAELWYDITNQKWILYRIRDDRKADVDTGLYFGNNFQIAEMTWRNYQNPLSFEILTGEQTDAVYFQEHDSNLYKASRTLNSYVKSQIFEQHMLNASWVIDLGSGKGQDLSRYAAAGVTHILFIEQDKDALTELLSRKYDYVKHNKESGPGMKIYIKELNLNDKWEHNIAKIHASGIPIPHNGVPLIFSSLALHYMIQDDQHMENIIQFIVHLLKPTGKFIYTAFNGKEVYQRLKDNQGRWSASEPDSPALKYDIKQKYKSSIFTGISQSIDVLLPFSAGEYYTEFLVNNDLLAKYFKKNKIDLISYESFSEYYDKYKKNTKNKYPLSKADQDYNQLYWISIYENNRKETADKKGTRERKKRV